MNYILKYEIKSKYLHFVRCEEKDFKTLPELRKFINDNLDSILNFKVYHLTSISKK